MAGVTFPNESDDYRTARNALLHAEDELRKQVERVAALRRELPLGGALPKDYEFVGAEGKVALSQLFAEGKDTLFLYGYMYGPSAEAPCPLCTSFLDSLNGNAPHLAQRISLAVAARAPYAKLAKLAERRGWSHLRLVSSGDSGYHADYHAETAKGQMPMANVFVRRQGEIFHSWGSELLYADSDGDSRHIDLMWPLWNVLDLTPEGRGSDWYPSLRYG